MEWSARSTFLLIFSVEEHVANSEMGVLTTYGKQRVVFYYEKGYKAPKIADLLVKEGIRITQVSVYRFLLKYEETGSMRRFDESGRPTKFTPEVQYT